MANKKQTAVEWLQQKFKEWQIDGYKATCDEVIQLCDIAKEPEKQQIVDAYKAGEEKEPHTIISRIERDAEQYYAQTYGEGAVIVEGVKD